MDRRSLGDGHLGLGDGAVTRHVDRATPEEVEDPHAARPALLVHLDELVGRALEPGGHHPPGQVPNGAEALPVPGVAPQHPILDQLANLESLGRGAHGGPYGAASERGRTIQPA